MLLLQIRTQSDPNTLTEVRHRVSRALIDAGLNHYAAEDMRVAVSEVLANVYRHAYHEAIGPVSVRVSRFPSAVSVVVTDNGDTTLAPSVPRSAPSLSRRDGLGLYLVGRLTDDVVVRVNRRGHGLTVRLAKRVEVFSAPTDNAA